MTASRGFSSRRALPSRFVVRGPRLVRIPGTGWFRVHPASVTGRLWIRERRPLRVRPTGELAAFFEAQAVNSDKRVPDVGPYSPDRIRARAEAIRVSSRFRPKRREQTIDVYGDHGDVVAREVERPGQAEGRTPDERREETRHWLLAYPDLSLRGVADLALVAEKTVMRVRREMERAGELEPVAACVDRRGRRQPATKKSAPATGEKTPANEPKLQLTPRTAPYNDAEEWFRDGESLSAAARAPRFSSPFSLQPHPHHEKEC